MRSTNTSIGDKSGISFQPEGHHVATTLLSSIGLQVYKKPIATFAVHAPTLVLQNPDYNERGASSALLAGKEVPLPIRTSTKFDEWNFFYPFQKPK
jgi:hypothetical protein